MRKYFLRHWTSGLLTSFYALGPNSATEIALQCYPAYELLEV